MLYRERSVGKGCFISAPSSKKKKKYDDTFFLHLQDLQRKKNKKKIIHYNLCLRLRGSRIGLNGFALVQSTVANPLCSVFSLQVHIRVHPVRRNPLPELSLHLQAPRGDHGQGRHRPGHQGRHGTQGAHGRGQGRDMVLRTRRPLREGLRLLQAG